MSGAHARPSGISSHKQAVNELRSYRVDARHTHEHPKTFKPDMSLFPHWLWPGALGVPRGGTARKVEKIHLNDPYLAKTEEE